MASAIRPSSTVKVSVFETLSGDRNDGLIDGEDHELEHEQHQRPELGHGDEALEERALRQGEALAGEGRNRPAGPRRWRRYLPDRMSS